MKSQLLTEDVEVLSPRFHSSELSGPFTECEAIKCEGPPLLILRPCFSAVLRELQQTGPASISHVLSQRCQRSHQLMMNKQDNICLFGSVHLSVAHVWVHGDTEACIHLRHPVIYDDKVSPSMQGYYGNHAELHEHTSSGVCLISSPKTAEWNLFRDNLHSRQL